MTPPRPVETAVAAAKAAAKVAADAAKVAASAAKAAAEAASIPSDRAAVSPTDAAKLLSISRATMYRLLDAKKISAKRIGRRKTLVAISELRRFLGEKTS